jgi:hypothetical protein
MHRIHIVYASQHKDHAFPSRAYKDLIAEIDQAMAQGKDKIIFNNLPETMMPMLILKVQRIVNTYTDLDPNNIFFSTSAPYGQEVYDKMADRNGWHRRIKILCGHNFESVVHNFMRGIENEIGNYEVKLKDKKFVCFNKVHRMHRVKLLAEMLKTGLISDGYYSFQGASPDWMNAYINWTPSDPAEKEFFKIVEDNKDIFPIKLNITPERDNPVDLIPDDLQYHQNSYFSIITETIFYKFKSPLNQVCMLTYDDTLFVSEKTYKAIGFKHPFIVLGWPGTIKLLRDRGFKTFHPWINESYDEEDDDATRMQMVFAEIKRLCELTPEQWIEWQTALKDIVEHNYELLRTRTDFRASEPVDNLFK